MTSPFIGNNNTILNVMGEFINGTNYTYAFSHSYGTVDNMIEQYPPVAMTSDVSGGYTSSTSGSSAGSPFNAFDNSTSTWSSLVTYNATTGAYTGATSTVTNTGTLLGEWLQLDFPTAIIVNALGFIPSSFTQYANNWRLLARNSVGDTWQVIYTETNTVCFSLAPNVGIQVFGLNPNFTTAYNSYRLIFLNAGPPTSSSGRDRVILQEVKFYGYLPTRTNSGTWKLRQSVNFWYGEFDAIFRQPIGSQQPTINTVVVRPSSVDFSRTAQQSMYSNNRVPFLMDTRGGFTAVAYVRLNSSAGDTSANNECIFDFGKGVLFGPQDASIVLRRNGTSSALEFYMEDTLSPGNVVQLIGGTIVPGQWTTIVVRYDKGLNIVQLYQDSVLVTSATPAPIRDRLLTSLYIGRSNNPLDTVTLDGSVGGLVMYDKALTDAQITALSLVIYNQNQIFYSSNVPDYNARTVRVLLLPVFANAIFTSNCQNITYSKNRWVGVGSRNTSGPISFAYSSDGVEWTPANSAEVAVTAANNGFGMAYNNLPDGSGAGSTAFITVPDGTWTLYALRDFLNHMFAFFTSFPATTITVSLTSGRFGATISTAGWYLGSYGSLALQLGYAEMYSTFFGPLQPYVTTITAPNIVPNLIFTDLGSVVATNGSMWVAGGRGTNTLAYSNDAVSWTGIGTSIFSTNGSGVAWGNAQWVAVGQGTNTIAYSTDGIAWTGIGTSIFNSAGNAVAWNGSLWVAVGMTTNTIAYSNNGTIWTGLGNTVISSQGLDVAWNGKLWVVVGSGTVNVIATSTDGITWTGRGKPNGLQIVNRVRWNGSYWMVTGRNSALGSNLFFISQDGITWTGYTGQSLSNLSLGALASRFAVL